MKPLNEYRRAKLQGGFRTGLDPGPYYRIRVKDKWWHRWKTFAESCFPDAIHPIWNKRVPL